MTCFLFYCTFYFTCDRSFPGRVDDSAGIAAIEEDVTGAQLIAADLGRDQPAFTGDADVDVTLDSHDTVVGDLQVESSPLVARPTRSSDNVVSAQPLQVPLDLQAEESSRADLSAAENSSHSAVDVDDAGSPSADTSDLVELPHVDNGIEVKNVFYVFLLPFLKTCFMFYLFLKFLCFCDAVFLLLLKQKKT